MADKLQFRTRDDFRSWLHVNAAVSEGIWLIFSKKSQPETLKRAEALEEALCFGWIDGQIQRMDDALYKVYFAQRTKSSRWSEKNKALVKELERLGLMTALGQLKVDEAKKSGMWNPEKPLPITGEQIETLEKALQGHDLALGNFLAMSPSVKRTYTALYLDAKTEETRKRRLDRIIDRLNKNLKPM